MKPFFKDLFEYSHHFNQKLADVFVESPDRIPEKSVKLFNHILNAHRVWNTRIKPGQEPFGVWDLHPAQDFKNIDQINYEQSLLILDNFDFNEMITYTTSKGQRFTNSIRDILFHVINHSTYHRGQIAADFRQNGLEPLVTDYVFYKR
ncbi:MAG TPA: DinB family protein [Cyclobacteriaceae bacterium]|nr:DinB family protein [Cyclobacteriaceae bacterium]